MECLSIILFSFYSLAILAESTSTESTTIGTSWDNIHDNSTQVGEEAKDPSYLNNASNVSTISTSDFSSNNIKDTQHLRDNGDKENDADHKEEPSEDLSSHDILLDPSLIPARLSRQTEKGNSDYSNLASISNDIKFNNHDYSRSVLPKSNLNYEGDLSMAEDRYSSAYPYWNLYYRRQFPNHRYRANDRRERYRNYWRYPPVFSGK